MKRLAILLATVLWIGTLVSAGLAQRPDGARPEGGRPGGGALPQVGTTLPTITLYDENGQEFSTDSLRGHYTVIVFGCLT
jgi:cytochrome oxidase Cu insertion factor (SCO1/SenC/PrrC family)